LYNNNFFIIIYNYFLYSNNVEDAIPYNPTAFLMDIPFWCPCRAFLYLFLFVYCRKHDQFYFYGGTGRFRLVVSVIPGFAKVLTRFIFTNFRINLDETCLCVQVVLISSGHAYSSFLKLRS
jgi:hypothetical protein